VECAVHIVTTKSMTQVTYPYVTQVSPLSLNSLNLWTHTCPNAFLTHNLQPDKNSSDILNHSVDPLFAGEHKYKDSWVEVAQYLVHCSNCTQPMYKIKGMLGGDKYNAKDCG